MYVIEDERYIFANVLYNFRIEHKIHHHRHGRKVFLHKNKIKKTRHSVTNESQGGINLRCRINDDVLQSLLLYVQ